MSTLTNLTSSVKDRYEQIQSRLQPLREGRGTLNGTIVTYAATPTLACAALLYATDCIGKTIPALCSAVHLGSWLIYGNQMYTTNLPRMHQMVIASCLVGEPGVDPETGAWKTNDSKISQLSEKLLGKKTPAYWHFFNSGLCNRGLIPWLREIHAKTVLEVCCGEEAPYVKAMNKQGIDARGIDLNLNESVVNNGFAVPGNILNRFPEAVDKKFDVVLSVESGGKLPKGSEDKYIQKLISHAEKAIFCSWPIPGQPGPHQTNTLSNAEVTDIFNKYGWVRDFEREKMLKTSADKVDFWLQDTIMVFVPKNN